MPLDKGMTELNIVLSLRAIPEVTQEDLSQERQVPFHQAGVVSKIGIEFLEFCKLLSNLAEDIGYGLGLTAPDPGQKRITRLHIQLHSGHTGAVLAAVVLFFYQQVHLVKTPEY